MDIMKCNCCGKEIKEEHGIVKEEVLAVVKDWGYFSGKDMERHRFQICEKCYDKWVSGFQIPPVITERTEVL